MRAADADWSETPSPSSDLGANRAPSATSRRDALVRFSWGLVDTSLVIVAVFAAAWLRYDLHLDTTFGMEIVQFALALGGAFVFGMMVVGFRARSHVRGSFEETAQVLKVGALAWIIAVAAVFATPWFDVPRSLPFVAPALAVLGMFAVRFLVRSYRWGRSAARPEDTRVVVFGAGRGGKQLLRALHSDVSTGPRLVPVALLDDDPLKRRWRLSGHKVAGTLSDLPKVVKHTGATTLAVAIPSIDQAGLRRIQAAAEDLDLDVMVLPPPAQILGAAQGADLRRLNLEDLLGRRSVSLDASAIAQVITGRIVLVTGAGGSIGSELCRQISRFGPARLALLDRDESALHAAQMSLTGRALLDDGSLALCDIRDFDSTLAIFEQVPPDLVFHAAALKHLTLLEQFPLEAWKSNVLGTRNVLEAAHRVGVQTFVNISTDKAADPTCVLGYSKRVAERITADYADRSPGTYVSVRFGNVLGSRGSVITAFTEQIERGGPVTVTHPDVERYFMLIPEACQLVLQAAAIGADGEVMVLDMGTPVKIADVAKQLIRMSRKSGIEIVYTGLRPGEKLSEALFSTADAAQPSAHPMVTHVEAPRLDASRVTTVRHVDHEQARHWMADEAMAARDAAHA